MGYKFRLQKESIPSRIAPGLSGLAGAKVYGIKSAEESQHECDLNLPGRFLESLMPEKVKSTCVQASLENGGFLTVTIGRLSTGLASQVTFFGFQNFRSEKTPNRKSRGKSLSKSTKNAPLFQANWVI